MTIHTNSGSYRSPTIQEVTRGGLPGAIEQKLFRIAWGACPAGKEVNLTMFASAARLAYLEAAKGHCEFADVSAWLQDFGESRDLPERFGIEAFHDTMAAAAEETDMDFRKRRQEEEDRAFRDGILPDPSRTKPSPFDEMIARGKAEKARKEAKANGDEDLLALRFSERHADELRYIAVKGEWRKWNGNHWKPEATLLAFDLARRCCRDVANGKFSAKTVAAVERLAKADRRHATTIEQWDANDLDFNAENT
jgi:hypothetical protein